MHFKNHKKNVHAMSRRPILYMRKWWTGTKAEHEFFLVINVKMPTAVGILTFKSRKK